MNARRPGPDSTLDDVRAKLIEAGTVLLRERGVDLGFAEVPLSDAIAEAGVTRSTAYRSLAHEELAPQAVLHRTLMKNLLTRYTEGATRSEIEQVIGDELQRQGRSLEEGTVADRTRAMRSIIRVGANCSYELVVASPERSILTAMYGALRSNHAEDWRHDALVDGERGLNTLFSTFYGGLAGLFQYRVKPPFTMDQFATTAASLLEGLAMRHGFNDELRMVERPTGADGATEDWSLFAIAFEAQFTAMFEPMNLDEPFADLLHF